jgi:hypothetical protein
MSIGLNADYRMTEIGIALISPDMRNSSIKEIPSCIGLWVPHFKPKALILKHIYQINKSLNASSKPDENISECKPVLISREISPQLLLAKVEGRL